MKRIITLSIVFIASTCFAQMYTVIDLGTLGGTSSFGAAINSSGQVVGWAILSNGEQHAVLYSNGTVTDLGVPICIGGGSSEALGINDSGQIVGFSRCSDGSYYGWILINGTATMIPTPSACSTSTKFSIPEAINASGQVTGRTCSTLAQQAFLYDSKTGLMTSFGSLTGNGSDGLSINKFGQITGYSQQLSSDGTEAFLYSGGVTTHLGSLAGGIFAQGTAINDLGQIAGNGTTAGSYVYHPFFYDGSMHDLGKSAFAHGMNNYGQIVGVTLDFPQYPFLYASNSEFIDLNTLIPSSAPRAYAALAINDRGQITGATGNDHAFLMSPIYKAFVQQPIDADGSSVFSARRGVIPVKFAVTQYNWPSCTLPGTIGITRIGAGTIAAVDESVYSTQTDSSSNFRIDSGSCQYVYNLAASALGVGMYRVDISINGIMLGHAVFALK